MRARVGLCLGLILLVSGSCAGAASASGGDPNLGVLNQSARTVNFDNGWRFQLVNTSDTSDPTGTYGNSSDPKAAAPGFNDSSWQRVTLPHDWSITQLPRPDQSNATGYFPGGLGWYRKTFTLPPRLAGARISIDFDGVFENSYVYLNGQLLGNHPYGYTGYSFDVSKLVHADGRAPNVLAVVVQNLEPSSRWYSGSGITRHVHLTATAPIHVARWGTFVTTPKLADTIQSGFANVHVATNLANDGGRDAHVETLYLVRVARGRIVASARPRVGVQLLTGGPGADSAELRVEHPTLCSTV